jgi:hypothetical protein
MIIKNDNPVNRLVYQGYENINKKKIFIVL